MNGPDQKRSSAADQSKVDPTPTTVGEALAIHQAKSERVLAAGNGRAIKDLYVELGTLLESAVGADIGSVPLLSYPEIAPVVADRLRDRTGPMLDAGSGPLPALSLMLGAIAPRCRIVAMDISFGLVRLARTRAAAGGVTLSGVVGDLEALPFRDAAFAGIGCDDTIEHVPDDRTALAELARVLTPSGRLVLTTPNRRRLDVLRRRLSDILRGRRLPPAAYYAATSHLREYTWRQLLRLVRGRFVIRERTTVDWSGKSAERIASMLVRLRPLSFASRMIVLVLEPKSHPTA
jgi:SAM-dependent methyltransferase